MMKQQTRYRYEKRIEELEKELSHARKMSEIAREIFDGAVTCASNKNSLCPGWVLAKFKRLTVWVG